MVYAASQSSYIPFHRPIKVAAGQADGIQPRTLEVLQSYGLAEPLLRQGAQMHMAVSARVWLLIILALF